MNETKQLLLISSILGVCGLGLFLYKTDKLENLDASEDETNPDDEAVKPNEEEVNSEYAKVKKQNKTRRVKRQINGTRRKSPVYV